MGGRRTERRYELCANVDAILRVGKGLIEIEFWGTLREEARRKGKDVTMGIISAGKGVGAAAEEDDSWSGKLETHVA